MKTSDIISVLWLVFITGISGHAIGSEKKEHHNHHSEKIEGEYEISNEIVNTGRKHHGHHNGHHKGRASKQVKITKKTKYDCCNGNGICYLGNFCHCKNRYYGRYCEYYLEHEFCGPEIPHGTWHPTGCFMCFCFNGEMDCMRQRRFDTCTMEEPFPMFPWEKKPETHANKKTHHHNKEKHEYNAATQHNAHHALLMTIILMVVQILYIF